MTKEELVKIIAQKADVSQYVAQKYLNAFLEPSRKLSKKEIKLDL